MKKIFPSQMENEEIFLVVREHWIRLIFKIIAWFMLVLVLVLFIYYGEIAFPQMFVGDIGTVTSLFMQVYVLFLALALFIIWLIHYLNIQIITSLRVVESNQIGLFAHDISELHIDKREDVSSETKGIFGTMFNYGMVYVQTAGSKEKFSFENVPDPGNIEKIILDLYEKNSNFAKENSTSIKSE